MRTGFLLLAGVLAIVALAFPPASLAGGGHHGGHGHGHGHGHHGGHGHGHHGHGHGHGHHGHGGHGHGHHGGHGHGHGGGGHGCTPPYCPSHTLKVKKKGSGSGTVTSSPSGIECGSKCSAQFEKGTKVTLTASAAPGSSFAGWSGGGCSGTGTCVKTLKDDTEVKATFNANPSYGLAVDTDGSGSGTVTSSPAGIDCSFECWAEFEKGTEVTLTAGAAPGSSFAGWSGGGCSGTGTCVLTLEDDEEVTATFDAESEPPPLSVEPGGRVEVARRALVRGGKAALKLTCFDDPCNGTLRLTARGKKKKAVLIGGAAFSLEAGASGTIEVRLSRAARKALAKRRILMAKVSGTGITTSPVILRLAKKKN